MSDKTEQIPEIIDDLRRIFHAIHEYSRAAERETSLTGPQLWALKILAGAAPLRVSELARRMYLRPATVVGILDRLEAKGLVLRNRCKEDRRAVDLELTDLGKEVVAGSPEVAQVALLKGLEALPDPDFDCVLRGMRHLVRILGAEKMTPLPLG